MAPAPLYGAMLGAVLATVLWGAAYAAIEAAPSKPSAPAPYANPYPLYSFGVLLASYTVREAIQLTEEQRRCATEIAKPIADRYYMVQQQYQSRPTGLLEKMPELLELQAKIREEINQALEALLRPDQRKRYQQIQLQAKGIRGLSVPEVQDALHLTDDQKAKINAIDRRLHQDIGDMPGVRPWNVRARIKAYADRSGAAMEEVVSVLDDEQRKAWKELVGEPVEIRYRMPIAETASRVWKRLTAGWSRSAAGDARRPDEPRP